MTKKIERMTKANCALLRKAINDNLAELGESYGVEVHAGNARYDDNKVTFKLVLSVAGVDLARVEFNECCYLFDLTPDDWGKELKWAGRTYTLTGLAPRSPKYPVLASYRGETFKLPERALEQIKTVTPRSVEVVDFKPRKPGTKGAVGR